jgi:hypothetical protein
VCGKSTKRQRIKYMSYHVFTLGVEPGGASLFRQSAEDDRYNFLTAISASNLQL